MKRRILKSISAIAAVSVLACQSVSAVTYDAGSGLDTDTSVITVKGVTDNKLPDRPVSIDITIGGKTVYADQVQTDENGGFDVKVKIPEKTESGSLAVKARGYLEAAGTDLLPVLWYAAPAELLQLVEDLNDGNKSLEDILADSTDSDFINLNIQLSFWDSSLAGDVADLLDGTAYTSAGDVKEKIYTAAVIAAIRDMEADDAVKFLKETDDGGTRLSMLKLVKQAEELFLSSDKIASFAAESMDKKCDTADEFIKDFEQKIAVGNLNAATSWGSLNSRIIDCEELLGLDDESYEDVFDKFSDDSDIAAEAGKVMIKLVPFKDAEDFCKEFKTAVSNAGKEEKKKGGSSPRGNNSSGGSSIATAGKDNVNADTDETPVNTVYSDVGASHWAHDSIMAMTEKGIVSGDGSGNFYPDNAVTREEFVKMLVLSAGLDISQPKAVPYTDVSESDWFYPYVAAAREYGLVLGVSETEFGTGEVITREQMAAICYRAGKKTGRSFDSDDTVEFTDADQISDYAKEAVSALAASGVLNGMGDNTFVPQGEVTRAQAAQVNFNFYRTEGVK